MIDFFIGLLMGIVLSALAAVPALLLMWGGRQGELKHRLGLWGIGVLLRFSIIGVGLYFLFTETSISRIPTVAGVVIAYFVIYVFEAKSALRS
jgi:hypothetical protein